MLYTTLFRAQHAVMNCVFVMTGVLIVVGAIGRERVCSHRRLRISWGDGLTVSEIWESRDVHDNPSTR